MIVCCSVCVDCLFPLPQSREQRGDKCPEQDRHRGKGRLSGGQLLSLLLMMIFLCPGIHVCIAILDNCICRGDVVNQIHRY